MKAEIKIILIVDDCPEDVELTIASFAENNLINEVVVAEDGVEALDYLYKRGKFAHAIGNPAIILLDIKMPRMDGVEVLRHIRSNPKFMFIPVIMLTSSCEEKDMVESYQLGANSYVVKPIDVIQFIDAVKVLGQYWAIINQSLPVRN